MNTKTPSFYTGRTLRECIEKVTTLDKLAEHIGEQKERILEICNGEGFATPLVAVKLGRALRANPELWLNLDAYYDLHGISEDKYSFVTPLVPQGDI